jgi:hypothetical protein
MIQELELQTEALSPEVIEGTALPVCLPPWRENPYRLVSLLDLMKAFKARDLLYSARDLHNRATLIFEKDSGLSSESRAAMVNGFKDSLREFKDLCDSLALPMSSLHTSQLLETVDNPSAQRMLYAGEAERIATMLSITVENEVSLRLYFEISPDKAKFHGDNAEPFGVAVATAFPSVSFDAGEASRCYALGRNTACVFHLMRVLEIGLGALAKQFQKPYDHTNWETIINQIEKAIGEMDKDPNRPANWKAEREFWSQCVSHFRIVKDAWRNYTAHARGKYDEQEALDMLGNVRGFLQKLATRLHE